MLTDIGQSPLSSTPLQCDNQSAISLAKNYVQHNKSKHIAIHYHYVRYKVRKGTIMIEHCLSAHMIADIFTKGLNESRFILLRSDLGFLSALIFLD